MNAEFTQQFIDKFDRLILDPNDPKTEQELTRKTLNSDLYVGYRMRCADVPLETFNDKDFAFLAFLSSAPFLLVFDECFRDLFITLGGHKMTLFFEFLTIKYAKDHAEFYRKSRDNLFMQNGKQVRCGWRHWLNLTQEERNQDFNKLVSLVLDSPHTPVEVLAELI